MDQSSKRQDFIASLAKNYRVLPLYEKLLADAEQKKQVSLQQNKYLARKWQEHKNNIETKKRIPFDFPHVSDFHFYINQNRYKPSESINQRNHYRYSLVPGPGVDEHGDIPIPNDICFRSNNKQKRTPVLMKGKAIKRMKKI